jgi:putative adhesin/cell wall-active antibiotic response 4TMS protein YvqF
VASPVIPPTPIPPPRPHRSIAGPVVLILMGILFLMGTMGIMDIHHLGSLFARFWPALLILWGVLKLIEYEQAKRYGQPVRGIGVGGVFLMLFLIVAGLMATQASRVDWKNLGEHIQLGDDEGLDEIFGGSTFNYSDELTQEIPAGSTLHVNDDRGTITVNVAEGKTMKVSVRKKVRAENEQDADRYNTKTKPQITVADKVVTLDANVHGAGDKGVTADLDVFVPRNTDLVIVSRRGGVTINGMNGNVEVNHQHGEVSLNDQTGNAVLTLERSSVRAQHVKGDITIQGHTNEVSLEDIDGAVHLSGEFYESTRLVRISKSVSFHSSRTEMEFSRLDGRLDLDSGDLRADSLTGPMRLTTRSKDIALDGFSGDLRLEDSNGTVEVGLGKPGNIQIDNRKGDVQVSIPPNTPIKVEARTREGEIESDFEEIKVENRDRESSASGSIGTNGPKLVMNCEKGQIEIRKGTVAAAPPVAPIQPFTPPNPGKPLKALPAPKAKPVESEN